MTLPFDLTTGAAAYMAVAVLVAAFVRGYSGFGFSAMVIAASALVTNPLNTVAVVVICEAVMSVQSWRGAGANVDWRRVGYLLAGAVIGLPIGLWAINAIPVDAARAVISVYILIMCLVLLSGWSLKREVHGPVNFGVGIVSGLANAPGMAGLPVAAFFAAQTMPAAVFRATLVAYFPLLDIISGPLYFYHGMVSMDTLWASLMTLPMVFLGNWAGGRHFLNTDPQDFRKFAIGLLALLALMGLIKSVI
jgi:uncharacterized membrane protein YfcA